MGEGGSPPLPSPPPRTPVLRGKNNNWKFVPAARRLLGKWRREQANARVSVSWGKYSSVCTLLLLRGNYVSHLHQEWQIHSRVLSL